MRPATKDDAAAITEMFIEQETLMNGDPESTVEDLYDDWSTPGFDMERDSWVVFSEDLLVGYVVIAIAVFDVAKYLIEEEVVREREMREVGEVRRSLTRFILTILIAVFLEAIVLIFKVSDEDLSLAVYPTFLLLAGVAMLIGLGAFQRYAAVAEKATGEHEDVDNESPSKGSPKRRA